MRAGLAIVSWSVLAAIGCRSESTSLEIVEPPSFVRFAVPADSSENIHGSTDISITFRRPVPIGTARLDLFPAPLAHGDQIFSPTGRNLSWLDVELDPDEYVYRLLIDGASIPSPEMIEYFPTTRPGVTGRMGGCLSLRQPGPDLSEAVVFALRPGDFDLSYDALPDFFRQQHATAATLVGNVPGRCANFYFLTYLNVEPLVVIAVLDTTGDGVYDLAHDWWGTRGTATTAGPSLPSDSPFSVPMEYDISIGPPPR